MKPVKTPPQTRPGIAACAMILLAAALAISAAAFTASVVLHAVGGLIARNAAP